MAAVQFSEHHTALGGEELKEFYPEIFLYKTGLSINDNVLFSVIRAVLNEDRYKTMDMVDDGTGFQLDLRGYNSEQSKRMLSELERKMIYNESDGYSKRLRIDFVSDSFAPKIIDILHQKFDGCNDVKVLLDVEYYILQRNKIFVCQIDKCKTTLVVAPISKKYRVMHLLASCISRIVPWAFVDYPLNDYEKSYLKALSVGDYDTFMAAMDDIYRAENFYKRKLNNLVANFSTGNYQRKIDCIEQMVVDKRYRIERLLKEYHQLQDEIEAENLKILNFRNKMIAANGTDNELLEFLQSNKIITVLRGSNSQISLGVNCFLNDCDEDMFKHYVLEPTSENYVYTTGLKYYDFDLLKRFFKSIWDEHRFNIRVYCEWFLKSDGTVEAIRNSVMNNNFKLIENRMPQPHIDMYGCYSGYKMMLEDLARESDYVGILSTIIASSASLNWTDSTVVRFFMCYLFNSEKKIIEDNNKNLYTVAEVMNILKVEKESEDNASN